MHAFVVVMALPVECLLRSDFLMIYAAIIDYTKQHLLLANSNKVKTPLCESGPIDTKAIANVIVLQNVTIAVCTVQKLMVQLNSTFQPSQIGNVGLLLVICAT